MICGGRSGKAGIGGRVIFQACHQIRRAARPQAHFASSPRLEGAMSFSILIVDDHPLMAAALAGVLQDLRSRVNCHVAPTGAAARQLLARQPDVGLIVLDLALPDTDGFGLLAYLREAWPDTPVMVVSASESVEDMRRAMAAGAAAYVPKSAAPATMLKAAGLALRGEVYLPPVMTLAPAADPAAALAPAAELLTDRQLDVLRLVCAGRSNKFIAYELGVAEKTVKGRITAIFKALNVDNRTQALLKASRLGLFTLQELAAGAAQARQAEDEPECREPPGG